MKNPSYIKFLFPLVFNFLLVILYTLTMDSMTFNMESLLILSRLFFIPTLGYFLFFFTIGFLFKEVLQRTIFSLTLTYICYGLLFKLFHWPGATLMLLISALIFVIQFGLLLYKTMSDKWLFLRVIINFFCIYFRFYRRFRIYDCYFG